MKPTVCTCPKFRWNPLRPFAHENSCAIYGLSACRACNKPLLPENVRIADGCPCNSPRGVNHGLVHKNTCTCADCDPAQTGSAR